MGWNVGMALFRGTDLQLQEYIETRGLTARNQAVSANAATSRDRGFGEYAIGRLDDIIAIVHPWPSEIGMGRMAGFDQVLCFLLNENHDASHFVIFEYGEIVREWSSAEPDYADLHPLEWGLRPAGDGPGYVDALVERFLARDVSSAPGYYHAVFYLLENIAFVDYEGDG